MDNKVRDRFDAHRDDPHGAAALLAELTGELSGVARMHRFDALAYLLDMARLEADSISRTMRQHEECHDHTSATRPPV